MIHFVAKCTREDTGTLDVSRRTVSVEPAYSRLEWSWDWRAKSRHAEAAFIFALRAVLLNPFGVDHDYQLGFILPAGWVRNKNS
jgi:hypothetical protein